MGLDAAHVMASEARLDLVEMGHGAAASRKTTRRSLLDRSSGGIRSACRLHGLFRTHTHRLLGPQCLDLVVIGQACQLLFELQSLGRCRRL